MSHTCSEACAEQAIGSPAREQHTRLEWGRAVVPLQQTVWGLMATLWLLSGYSGEERQDCDPGFKRPKGSSRGPRVEAGKLVWRLLQKSRGQVIVAWLKKYHRRLWSDSGSK